MTLNQKVVGMTTSPNNPLRRSIITVRVTSDEFGKSLSLENGKIMIHIPIEPVMELLKWVMGDENEAEKPDQEETN